MFAQVGNLEALLARLSGAQNIAGPAQFEVLLGQIKAILTFSQRIQPMLASLTDPGLKSKKHRLARLPRPTRPRNWCS